MTFIATIESPGTAGVSERIPAFRAALPRAENILPYLLQIDEAQHYSNHGPLVTSLQERLTDLFGSGANSVLATSSGTSALMAGILVHAGPATPDRPYALCPAYTFIATAIAAQRCGYVPYVADVSSSTWTLDPESLLEHPMLDQVGLVLPVSSYGRPLDVAAWERFQQSTGIRVVIDAAAGFEAIADGSLAASPSIPAAVSFHATKAFGCGEGGGLVWRDTAMLLKAFQTINFGFMGTRNSKIPSLNGKMSEYHAAVALAELDCWQTKKQHFLRAIATYREVFAHYRIEGNLISPPLIASNYMLFRTSGIGESEGLLKRLDDAGIDSRFWYGQGLHTHDILSDAPRDPLPNAGQLAGSLLGLPTGTEIQACQIERIALALTTCRKRQADL